MHFLWLQTYTGQSMEDYQLLFEEFLKWNGNRERTQATVNVEKKEIALYDKYKAHHSCGDYADSLILRTSLIESHRQSAISSISSTPK
jgi:hypothetical protein